LQNPDPPELKLSWSRRLSLTSRILAVNLFVLILFGAGLFFLDTYRERLILERQSIAAQQIELFNLSYPMAEEAYQKEYIRRFVSKTNTRIRIFDNAGNLMIDSFDITKPTYAIVDPDAEPFNKRAARTIDRLFDFLVRAPQLEKFTEPSDKNSKVWPELRNLKQFEVRTKTRLAPDFTHIITAASKGPIKDTTILSTNNARDIRSYVRAARTNVGLFACFILVISILLSLFLARTIVRPLRHLAHAAVKVRLGRAQEVTVPRLPFRRDEIGVLARALSDMSSALRIRIDATEAFAADVAHEIKNPLASLRSALDGIDNVKDPALKSQLLEVAKSDVLRMDRLINDISEASRVDSQLAKTKFSEIDLGDIIEQLLKARKQREIDGKIKIAFARPRRGVACVMGDDIRLERVINNLIDNAASFSPAGELVEISATRDQDTILIRVSDRGPGVPENQREAIFRRFYSERPASESFGKHSGLGLAISRTIIEGHEGEIMVHSREDGLQGACFEITLPAAPQPQ
jgi:two-component system, OmpR family, sensor histidine kinase ChvG